VKKQRDWGELRRMTLESVGVIVGSLAMSVLGLVVIQVTYNYGSRIFLFLGELLGRRGAEIVLVLLVCATGWLAHRFKQWQQGWYGLTEIVFGIVSALNVAFTMVPGSSVLAQWVALFGSTYIIVRGLGNLAEVTRRKKELLVRSDEDLPTEFFPGSRKWKLKRNWPS
jgi:hypothetical protein